MKFLQLEKGERVHEERKYFYSHCSSTSKFVIKTGHYQSGQPMQYYFGRHPPLGNVIVDNIVGKVP